MTSLPIDSNRPLGRPSTARANGLDTLRAAAIALVFMYHYMSFVSFKPTFGWLSVVGWVGVDLFFVLSGYLIANQIFAGVARGRQFSLKRFYARRALRTLPVFWLVLALYFLFPAVMGGEPPPPLWRFLTFTQNLGLHPGTAFSHAWSLCIEEQFYLALPLAVVAGFWNGRTQVRGWALLFVLLLVGVTARTVLWFIYGRESGGHIGGYYPNIYYSTLCRFDEFLPGIAVAMIKNFHRPLWDRLMKHGQLLLAIGSVAVVGVLVLVYQFYDIDDYGYGFLMTAAGYSLVSMAFALLVAAALSPVSWLHRVRVPGAYHIALWSYSIYLSHKAIAVIVKNLLAPWKVPAAVLTVVVAVLCVVVGALLYKLVESPFMAIRAQRFPTNFPDRDPQFAAVKATTGT
jgi:peptidoglycan/LPS O-acetylase OafA/YrhL